MPSYPVTTIEKLEGRINAVNTGELSKNLYQTLVSTTTQLREILMLGSLDQATGVVEDFYMPEHQQINEKRFIYFRLNNGFVDQSVNALKLEFAFTFDDLNGGDASEIPAQYLQIDEEKGYVTMDTIQFDTDLFSVYNTTRRTNFFREYLFRITYDHGFATKNTVQGPIYDGTPDWLEECALIKGREIYQFTVPSKDKPALDFSHNLAHVADPHIRFRPYALKPMVF